MSCSLGVVGIGPVVLPVGPVTVEQVMTQLESILSRRTAVEEFALSFLQSSPDDCICFMLNVDPAIEEQQINQCVASLAHIFAGTKYENVPVVVSTNGLVEFAVAQLSKVLTAVCPSCGANPCRCEISPTTTTPEK